MADIHGDRDEKEQRRARLPEVLRQAPASRNGWIRFRLKGYIDGRMSLEDAMALALADLAEECNRRLGEMVNLQDEVDQLRCGPDVFVTSQGENDG